MGYQGLRPSDFIGSFSNILTIDTPLPHSPGPGNGFDGSQTAFKLQYDGVDVGASLESLLVTLGGIPQRPTTDFTYADGVITFTTAPQTNLTVEIRRLQSFSSELVLENDSVGTHNLNLASTTAPTGVAEGDIYYDSTNDLFKVYDGTSWKTVGGWDVFSNYIKYNGGKVAIGSNAPTVSLDVGDQTDAIHLPTGTQLERPSNPEVGYFRFNTTIDTVEMYVTGGWIPLSTGASITSVTYPTNASGTAETAVAPGDTITLIGSGFLSGFTLELVSGGTTVTLTPTTYTSVTSISGTVPAGTANGTYDVKYTGSSGAVAVLTSAVDVDTDPSFNVASGSLATVTSGDTVNISTGATDTAGTVTFAVSAGSLPSGLSLNTSTGAITGTAPTVSTVTTSTFTLRATDDENQQSTRQYSITVSPPTFVNSGFSFGNY